MKWIQVNGDETPAVGRIRRMWKRAADDKLKIMQDESDWSLESAMCLYESDQEKAAELSREFHDLVALQRLTKRGE